MAVPRYDYVPSLVFGGLRQDEQSYDTARAVVLPIPLERTTSYVPGTRYGPREILQASAQVELWDEETEVSFPGIGLSTLPAMELAVGTLEAALAEIRRVAGEIFDAGKFLVSLGGEHSLTLPLVEAAAARHEGLSVLQIDAHADLRESYTGSPFSHASVMRRVVERVPCTQVGIRSLSEQEARSIPSLRTTLFYDVRMREEPRWMDRVVESLGRKVYVTIDCDGFDPALLPAVGTPEPGGLNWHEALVLLRKIFEKREVVACDVVELAPIPGMVAPNVVCARLVFKLLAYWYKAAGTGT
jgi:agmatinase